MIDALSLYLATFASPALAAVPPQDPPRVLEILSLRNFEPSRRNLEWPRLGAQLGEDWGDDSRVRELGDRDPFLEPDSILSLLGDIEQSAYDDGDLELDVQNQLLFVRGPRDVVQRVKDALGELEAAAQRAVTVSAHVVALGDGASPPDAILDAARTQAFLESAQIVWSGATRIPSGSVDSLGHQRFVPYVRDVDVEVAQKATISDPKVRRFAEGLHVTVTAHGLNSPEELVLEAYYSFTEQQAPMQTVLTRVKDQPSLDVPSLRELSGSLSGRIPNRGALVVSCSGSAGAPNVAIVLTADLDPLPQTSRARALSVSALTSTEIRGPNRGWMGDDSLAWPRSIAELGGGLDEDEEPNLSVDLIHEMIFTRFPQFSDEEGCSMRHEGSHIWIIGPADLTADVVELMVQLEQRFLVNDEHRLQVATDGGDLWALRTPALRDRWHAIFGGTETTVIADYEVEIAQKASLANPVVRSVFSGVAGTFCARSGTSAPTALWNASVSQAGYAGRRASESKDIGDLGLVPEARRSAHRVVPIIAGSGPVELGDGPMIDAANGSRQRTSMRIEVIPR